MTEEELARWRKLLVGKLCRVVNPTWTPAHKCPALIVSRVEQGSHGLSSVWIASDQHKSYYFNANGWKVEIFGQGVIDG